MANFFKAQTKKNIEKKHHEYVITRLDHQGDGIAFCDKKPLFISGALQGEKVVAQLSESKKSYARAKLIKVLEPSAERTLPFCPLYNQCGGCNLQHLKHQAQIEQKQQTLLELMSKLAKESSITLSPAIVDNNTAYRRRARLSVKLSNQGELLLGFRKRASNDIINVSHCPVLQPELNEILALLPLLLSKLKGKALIGHLELSTSDKSKVLFIRTTKKLPQVDIITLTNFAQEQTISLFIKQKDDVLQLLVGEEPYYLLDECQINYRPQNFLQVNEAINQKMVSQAVSWLEINKSESVLDLFCGLGNFSLPLAKRAKSVVGIEGVATMVAQANENARLNHIENIHFYHANLEQNISNTPWAMQRYEKILLDPARAGAFELMYYLSKSKAEKILYVSCNPATLARDSQILLTNGYKLTKLGLLDMFPHTGHLESMALFVKA